ncbi:MAG: type II toxin-antitoxin system ParD family antitoxin [Bifidobacteriaceae bacterium]|nr:type II toxin-antitoxin system ParD family antitoxin [Bifidobacteriaceae bacterium]
MATMNISMPTNLRSFVEEQVAERGYGTTSEYMRDLVRRDQERIALRSKLLAGRDSGPLDETIDDAWFDELATRAKS